MLTPPASDPSHGSLSDEAAHWCMRIHEADFSDQEREAFEAWLAADPAHKRRFETMLDVWAVSEHLPVEPLAPAAPARPRRARRPLLAAALGLLAIPLIGLAGWHLNVIPDSYQRYSSDNAVRDITLADGSHVQLNLGSRLSFANYKDQRSVTLSKGEAYFEVRHDASHPFVVKAGQGQVRVTGTHFNVWTYQDQVVVTLTQGSVQVMGDRRRPNELVYLSPGMQARYDAGQSIPQVGSAQADEALAWRDGKLILDRLRLSDALPRINRYLETPVHLGDNATGQLQIGGIYNTRNIAALVQDLPKVLPVYLSRNEEGDTVIRAKPRYAP